MGVVFSLILAVILFFATLSFLLYKLYKSTPSTIQLCHYTNDKGAEKIIRSGQVMASLKSVRRSDVAHGNGVYLTELKPGTLNRVQVAQNNWLDTSDHSIDKTKNFFVFEIPDSEVKNVSTLNRNLFIFGGRKDLRLVKYRWWLKNFNTGKIIASYKYNIGSNGPASLRHLFCGDYVMTEETVNGRPVYKHSWFNLFLFMSSGGKWLVGRNTSKDSAYLRQTEKYSLGPDSRGPWEYSDIDGNGKMYWNGDDGTLKAYPWQM